MGKLLHGNWLWHDYILVMRQHVRHSKYVAVGAKNRGYPKEFCIMWSPVFDPKCPKTMVFALVSVLMLKKMDGQCLRAQRGFLEPRRIISDEAKGAETDLVAEYHFAAENYDG